MTCPLNANNVSFKHSFQVTVLSFFEVLQKKVPVSQDICAVVKQETKWMGQPYHIGGFLK